MAAPKPAEPPVMSARLPFKSMAIVLEILGQGGATPLQNLYWLARPAGAADAKFRRAFWLVFAFDKLQESIARDLEGQKSEVLPLMP
jgi:hypothetical protein